MVRVGILGAGFMGRVHAECYARLEDVMIVAVASRSRDRAEQLAREYGARTTDDVAAIIEASDIDAVDICVPSDRHAEFAIRALEAGKSVLVEKPVALSLVEADAIIAAQRRREGVLMVGLILRFWPEYVKMREIAKSGGLGRPLWAYCQRLSTPRTWNTWMDDPASSGGVLVDLAIHDFDFLSQILGRPSTAFAQGIENPRTGQLDQIVTILGYREGRAVVESCVMMPASYPFSAGARILFEEAALEYRFTSAPSPGGNLRQLDQGPMGTLLLFAPGQDPEQLVVEPRDPFLAQLQYFVECVRESRPPKTVTAEVGRTALEVALAARESLMAGGWSSCRPPPRSQRHDEWWGGPRGSPPLRFDLE